MIRRAVLVGLALVALLGCDRADRRAADASQPGPATLPVTYALPEDRMPAELAQSDAEVVVNNCASCHSLDYIVTQPRGRGAKFWQDEVAKMLSVYKAPVVPEDADAVAKVLARKFG